MRKSRRGGSISNSKRNRRRLGPLNPNHSRTSHYKAPPLPLAPPIALPPSLSPSLPLPLPLPLSRQLWMSSWPRAQG